MKLLVSRIINKVKRYLRLYFYFSRFSLENVLIYRVNSLLLGLAPIIWMLTTIVFLTVIFRGTKEIAGWNFWELIFLTGVQEIIYLASWITFLGNLINFTYSINKGTFDIILLRPVNHRFLISFGALDITSILSIVNSIALLSIALINLKLSFSAWRILLFLLGLITAYLVIYLLCFILASLSLFWIKGETLIRWLLETLDFDRYPAEIYSDWFKVFLLTFLPILFLGYVPTAVFLGKLPAYFLIFGIFVVCLLYFLSTIIWEKGLRHYQSASG